jgi:hypothetical protein
MKLNTKGIRSRLITWYVISLGVVHVLVAVALYRTMSARLHHELDGRLETYATCLVELLPMHRQLDVAKLVGEMAELTGLGSDLYVRVLDDAQQVVYESSDSPEAVADLLRAGCGGRYGARCARTGNCPTLAWSPCRFTVCRRRWRSCGSC